MTILDRFRIDDRVAIVTGASSGLGAAFADVLGGTPASNHAAANCEFDGPLFPCVGESPPAAGMAPQASAPYWSPSISVRSP